MRSINHTLRAVPAALALLSLAAACSKDAAADAASNPKGSGASVQQSGGAAGGAREGGAGTAKGGAAGGRPSPSITLAPTDVATVGRMTIEDGVPLTGDLRPSETIDVRSRIEGDLTDVYVREGQEVS